MNIYSASIFQAQGLTADVEVSFNSPATYIVREIIGYNNEISNAQLRFSTFVGGQLFCIFSRTLDGPTLFIQDLHVVLPSTLDDGEGIVVQPSAGSIWDVTISGYALNGLYIPP